MELEDFVAELVSSLARLEFVDSISLQTEAFTVKGRVYLRGRGFLEVYFNEQTQTLAIAWIENQTRIWGIDRDNIRGWHRHPFENPQDHLPTAVMNVVDIINELGDLWENQSRDSL